MNLNNNADLARRFAGLPLPQRELFYQRLCSKGISFLQMPIPRVCEQPGARSLSYAQQRQWFLWQLEPDSARQRGGAHHARRRDVRPPADLGQHQSG